MPQNRLVTMPTKAKILNQATRELCVSRFDSKITRNKDHYEPWASRSLQEEVADGKKKPCARCRHEVAEIYGPLMTAYSDLLDTEGLAIQLRGILEAFTEPPSI